jgi:hypothetical protein
LVQAQSYSRFTCSDDCSGHEAGYEWANDNNIDDESDCLGNSQSFIESCYAYVEEHQQIGRLKSKNIKIINFQVIKV